MTARRTPSEVVFGAIAGERFPAVRDGIHAAGRDPRDRESFVLVKEVVELLRDLRAEDAPAETVAELVAFTHAAFLGWLDGEIVIAIDRETLDRILAAPAPPADPPRGPSYYLALPPRRVWGAALGADAAEPLDGAYVIPREAGRLDLVAIFGLHPGRDGFTVARASGPRAPGLARADGTALFSPRLPGGAAAGLHQITGSEELLELAFRCHALLPAGGAAPGVTAVSAV